MPTVMKDGKGNSSVEAGSVRIILGRNPDGSAFLMFQARENESSPLLHRGADIPLGENSSDTLAMIIEGIQALREEAIS